MSLTKTDKDDVRLIVREEIAGSSVISGMKKDIVVIKKDIVVINKDMTGMKKEITRTAGLMEDLDGKFDKVTELLSNNLKVKNKVDDHEGRIGGLEKDNELIKPTLALHSRQLKSLSS